MAALTAMSENAKAFSAKLGGLVQEHAAQVRAVEQRWKDTNAEAEKSAQETTEKGQKLVARIRERAQALKDEEAKRGADEIGAGEDPEADEADPEIERFSRQMVTNEKEREAAREADAGLPQTPAPEQTSNQWQVRAGRFGAPEGSGGPAAPRSPAAEAPNADWQVQAGRFGHSEPRSAPAPAPPQAPAAPPAPPKLAPRRPVFDEDDDFENESWLR